MLILYVPAGTFFPQRSLYCTCPQGLCSSKNDFSEKQALCLYCTCPQGLFSSKNDFPIICDVFSLCLMIFFRHVFFCNRRHVFCCNRRHVFCCNKEMSSVATEDMSSVATEDISSVLRQAKIKFIFVVPV